MAARDLLKEKWERIDMDWKTKDYRDDLSRVNIEYLCAEFFKDMVRTNMATKAQMDVFINLLTMGKDRYNTLGKEFFANVSMRIPELRGHDAPSGKYNQATAYLLLETRDFHRKAPEVKRGYYSQPLTAKTMRTDNMSNALLPRRDPAQAETLATVAWGRSPLGSGRVAGAAPALGDLRATDRLTTTTASMQIRRPFPVDGHGQPQCQSGLTSTAPVFVPGASGHITTKAASQRASVNRDTPDVGRPRIYEHHPYRVSFPADMGPQGNHVVAAMGIAQGRNVVGQPVDPIEARNFVIAPPFELAYSGLSQSSLHEQPLNRHPWIHPLVQQPAAQSFFSQYPAEMAYPTASRLSRTPDCGQELGKRVRKH
ncbi:hypothetical protein LTR99_004024 [Exophiala xenobiotica]|uniref:Uncharacterized protein n=1 Tax=Vermiconidia calcicola TaxID=1690605 RepID=A0AAV9PUQ0_9PEZI|nr:hypothetical protein LTR99_004024 [Exophiala xenobiotica]KAK5435491.1 hypothetical protein LTR34_002995 [Exophiala xenobiotica]KAK5529658.1 hypothetical protein LTR25_009437 [Vermiconidia calcicola]KAK5549138.1 hypothetical protein LTR23_000968 [Chaetothyriales sp. CCFEE 6169]